MFNLSRLRHRQSTLTDSLQQSKLPNKEILDLQQKQLASCSQSWDIVASFTDKLYYSRVETDQNSVSVLAPKADL